MTKLLCVSKGRGRETVMSSLSVFHKITMSYFCSNDQPSVCISYFLVHFIEKLATKDCHRFNTDFVSNKAET